jgi:photosystem II stability/assembly factor-like uncharacterized protein
MLTFSPEAEVLKLTLSTSYRRHAMLSLTKSRLSADKAGLAGKLFLHTLFFFLLTTQICFGQWYPQNSGTTKNLNAVQFVDENIGWAVGDSGLILKTSDAGASWISVISGTTENLNDIQIVNSDIGWIAGGTWHGSYPHFSAVILKTIDGGSNWSQQMVDTTYRLNAVSFIDDNIGWSVGERDYGIPGKILKTTNGGNNWISQSCQGTNGLFSVHFVDSNTGWAVGNDDLHKTTDGGVNWAILHPFWYLNSIFFRDSNTGWAVGFNNLPPRPEAAILKTMDGGTVWSSLDFGASLSLIAVHFSDDYTGWVVGFPGAIYKTTDEGDNWISQISGVSNTLRSVFVTDSNTAWVVGEYGTILHTTNGGVSSVDNETIQPTDFILSQNFPNPFNSATAIQYLIPQRRNVTLKVYDILGNEVASLVSEEKDQGVYTVNFAANNLASGLYFYQLKAGSFVETKKMILLR